MNPWYFATESLSHHTLCDRKSFEAIMRERNCALKECCRRKQSKAHIAVAASDDKSSGQSS